MIKDSQRLRRLALLARMRQVEHRDSAMEAQRSMLAEQRSRKLCRRAQQLAQLYGDRRDAGDGYDLEVQKNAAFVTANIAKNVAAQVQAAAKETRSLLHKEAKARRRKERVEQEYDRLNRSAEREADDIRPRRRIVR